MCLHGAIDDPLKNLYLNRNPRIKIQNETSKSELRQENTGDIEIQTI
jgi:hypothetical protein